MVKNDPGAGILLDELEPRNRVNAGMPVPRAPGLDNSLVRHELDVPSRDIPAEEREGASHFTTDLGALVAQVHGLQHATKLDDLVELFGVNECFVDALPAGFEYGLLVDRFRRMRNFLRGFRPSLG